jgi:hypothetical protein
MRWYLLKPLAALLGWAIRALGLLIALLGCLRFFLVTGASPRYLLQRKRWFEETMLGRKMRLADLVAFGAWHAEGQ